MKRLIPMLIVPLLLAASQASATSKAEYRAIVALAEQNKKTDSKMLQELFNIPQSQQNLESLLRTQCAYIWVRSNGVSIYSQRIVDGQNADEDKIRELAREVDVRLQRCEYLLGQLREAAREDRELGRTTRKLTSYVAQMQARSRAILRLLR